MEGFEIDKPPFFDGIHFDYWKFRMEVYIQSIDLDLWDIILDGFSCNSNQSLNANDKHCFSLNIRAMQILRNSLYDDAYDRIRNCSSAKDIWDVLNDIYISNHEFVHKVENKEQKEQISMEEDCLENSPQEDVLSCEMSLMPLDDGIDIQLEEDEMQNQKEKLGAFMDRNEKEDNLKEERIMQESYTTLTMVQKDYEVDDGKFNYSPSHDKLQYTHDKLHVGLLNTKEKILTCLQNISLIENQIQSLKNACYIHEEEICLKCETSSMCDKSIDIESIVEDMPFQTSIAIHHACLDYMVERKKKNDVILHEKLRTYLDCEKVKSLGNNFQMTKPSSKSIVCNYCGCLGHISHLCNYRRNSCMRNKLVWVPKATKVSNTNPQGPKMKWVPKCPPSNSFMQKNSQKEGQIGLIEEKSSREILPRINGKIFRRRKEVTSTKASQIQNGELRKFKTQKVKQWVRRSVPLIIKAKVSNDFTSCAHSFINAMKMRHIPCRP